MSTQERLRVWYRILWNHKSPAVGIESMSGKRDTMTMLWDRPDMCLLLRSVIAQPRLQDDPALVDRESEAKGASFCGAASKCSMHHRRLVEAGTSRAAAHHLIHPGCWFEQKHAEDMSE